MNSEYEKEVGSASLGVVSLLQGPDQSKDTAGIRLSETIDTKHIQMQIQTGSLSIPCLIL
jgi:hypothetical protein